MLKRDNFPESLIRKCNPVSLKVKKYDAADLEFIRLASLNVVV
jgi:hypothetical protein